MKYLLCICLFSFLICSQLESQEISAPWSIGISGVKSEYRGDLGHNLFDWKNTQYFGIGLQIKHYINPTFDMGLDLSMSDHGYWAGKSKNFLSKQYQSSLQLVYKFNNGYILKESSLIAPYLQAGLGHTTYKSDPKRGSNKSIVSIPLSLGVKVKVSRSVAMFVQSSYNLSNADDTDMMSGDINTNNMVNGNDHFLNHQLGFSFVLGNRSKKLDLDGDGITDFEDACPKVSGLAVMQGCPDTDLDGVKDTDDPCPNQSGTVLMGGCPDTDQDGIADHLDECPVNAGSIALRGCPDSDNDGVTDAYDECPFFAGSLANKGCPQIGSDTRSLLKKANKEVSFEKESSKFEESSILVLQELLLLLKEHPYYELIIETHVFDESNDEAFEMKLSQDRADVIKDFLITNGIDADKLIAIGYGSYRPINFKPSEHLTRMKESLEFKVNF